LPTVTIDGRAIEVPLGTSVIEAANRLGIFIPHYCYHPGLSVAGSCRMCLVKVEKAPKLQIACYTPATDGLVVSTTDNEVTVARQAILEFLLANHPLDCPVCDQAGECKLQEFYMQFGRYDSTLLEDKHKKHKALPVGPHIILDSERCILCSRCTRFVDDVTHTHELGIFERGVHSELLPVQSANVDNAYSGCLADICPVGALTDRDFRFKVRVWYLEATPSVCHGCARNCAIEIHTNRHRPHHNDGKLVARYKPRFNPAVNGYWMCDAGRYSYKQIEGDGRLLHPVFASAGAQEHVDWAAALARADDIVANSDPDSTAVIATPALSNEELWAVRKLLARGLKIATIAHVCPADPEGIDDDLLRRADTFPNSFGAGEILKDEGIRAITVKDVLNSAKEREFQSLIVIGGGLERRFASDFLHEAFAGTASIVAIQSHQSAITDCATIALPMCTYAETDGTICNFLGHVQRFARAIPELGESRTLLEILSDLAQRWEQPAAPRQAEECFAELAGAVSYFAGLSYDSLGQWGTNPAHRKAEAVAS